MVAKRKKERKKFECHMKQKNQQENEDKKK